MAECGATPEAHCCWVNGEVCPHFDPTGLAEGRDGACTLRSELGSWAAVHTDPRYLRDVKALVPSFTNRDCGGYPYVKCATCGATP